VGPKAAGDSNVEFVTTAFFGTTPTMETKWSNLKKMETETLLQIIMGEKPVDAFDTFVTQWNAAGGQEILGEIEASK
jgi:putative aldouronate transport system substrate-binding protein